MTGHWTERHRGPYRLYVSRPGKTARNEWLPGTTTAEEVDAEARALLADGRDTIALVCVWSVRRQRFVFTYKR